uniref:MHC class I antigen n=1 Tax=Haemonchus placei TaxID=6290 RepID=A0A0N4VT14_HAEPC
LIWQRCWQGDNQGTFWHVLMQLFMHVPIQVCPGTAPLQEFTHSASGQAPHCCMHCFWQSSTVVASMGP